jgi:hypothetical protein
VPNSTDTLTGALTAIRPKLFSFKVLEVHVSARDCTGQTTL